MEDRERIQKTLQRVNPTLRKYLKLDVSFLKDLGAKHVLTDGEIGKAASHSVNESRVDYLLDILKTSPITSYSSFLEILEKHDKDLHSTCIRATKDFTADDGLKLGDNDAQYPKGLQAISHMDYNDLTYKFIILFENKVLFNKAKWLCKSDHGTEYGIPFEKIQNVDPPNFILWLEKCQLLGPYNTEHVHHLMCKLGQAELAKEIDEYFIRHQDDKLHVQAPNGTSANGVFSTKIKYPGDIDQRSHKDVDQIKSILSSRYGCPEWSIGLTGIIRGSIVLVFQLPLQWSEDTPEGHVHIDVLGRLKDDVSQRADWLRHSDAIGIQIEGDDYVDLTVVSHAVIMEVRRKPGKTILAKGAGEIVLPVVNTQDVNCDNHPDGTPQDIYCNTCPKRICCSNMILLHHKDCRIITQPMNVEQYSTRPVAATPEKKSDKHPYETLLYESSIALSNEPELSILSDVRCDIWKQAGQFRTLALRRPGAITIHPDGNIALTHIGVGKSQAAIFTYSKDGRPKYSLKANEYVTHPDIAITSEGKYILPGMNNIMFYDCQGNHLEYFNVATYDINNKPSYPTALAVDSQDRIITGLWGETISIHQGDGHLISKFATPDTPYKLDVTSKGDIVVIYHDHMIQLMDYSGNNVRVLMQPDDVNDWRPQAVCCSKQDEVFILSGCSVYRYTCTADDDQYHGSIIISGLHNPRDIAITTDGQHLYVVEFMQSSVKIFQRPDNSAPNLD